MSTIKLSEPRRARKRASARGPFILPPQPDSRLEKKNESVKTESERSVRDPETPRNSGWPTVSGQPLRCLNVSESGYGILGASWIEGISIEIGD